MNFIARTLFRLPVENLLARENVSLVIQKGVACAKLYFTYV